jgi:hypothetical protein
MRTLPEAYMTLTLDEVAAAIATFADPLTADEVVALAQWWTVYHLHIARIQLISDTELELMARLGRVREACFYAEHRYDPDRRVEALARIYRMLPRPDPALRDQIYPLLDRVFSGKVKALPLMLEAEVRFERYETALQLHRLVQPAFNQAPPNSFLIQLARTGRVSELQRYLPEFPRGVLVRGYVRLANQMTLQAQLIETALQAGQQPVVELLFRYAETIRARLQRAIDQSRLNSHPLLNAPGNSYYSEALFALGTAYLSVGQLDTAATLFLHPHAERLPDSSLDAAAKRGLALCNDAAQIAAFAVALPDHLRNSALHFGSIRRLIALGEFDVARSILQQSTTKQWSQQQTLIMYALMQDEAMVTQLLNPYSYPRIDEEQLTNLAVLLIEEAGRLDLAEHICQHIDNFEKVCIVQAAYVHYWAENKQPDIAVTFVEAWLTAAWEKRDCRVGLVRLLVTASESLVRSAPDAVRSWLRRAEEIVRARGSGGADWRVHPIVRCWLILGEAEHAAQSAHNEQRYYAETQGLRALQLDDPQQAALGLRFVQTLRQFHPYPYDPGGILPTQELLAHYIAQYGALSASPLSAAAHTLLSKIQTRSLSAPHHLSEGLAQQHDLRLREWLALLAQAAPQLDAHTPGLYPRVLKACLEIMSNFAPEWLKLIRGLDETG